VKLPSFLPSVTQAISRKGETHIGDALVKILIPECPCMMMAAIIKTHSFIGGRLVKWYYPGSNVTLIAISDMVFNLSAYSH
jgi:hypothetical protein